MLDRSRLEKADPGTGEISDARDTKGLVLALLAHAHPEVSEIVSAGPLRLKGTRIAVTDPITHLHKQALAIPVTCGEHGVSLCCDRAGNVGAAVVRLSAERAVSVEQALFSWPWAEQPSFGSESGVLAIFDESAVGRLSVERQAELIEGCRRGGRIATIQLPRVKAWNVIAFRPAESAHADYSAFWARAADGSLVALVLDFRLFG